MITTDYVVDELLSLLRFRNQFRGALEIGPALFSESVCRIAWVEQADVRQAWMNYSTYIEKGWSFTDCVSRVVIERLGLEVAFAFDDHFRQFGTVQVVP